MNRFNFSAGCVHAFALSTALLVGCGGAGSGGGETSPSAATAGGSADELTESRSELSVRSGANVTPPLDVEVIATTPADSSGNTASTAASAPILKLRAKGSIAGGIGPILELRINGVVVGSVEVRATAMTDYAMAAPGLAAGTKVDIVYINDDTVGGFDRNLYISHVSDGVRTVLPYAQGVVYDKGKGPAAVDGIEVVAGQGDLFWPGALRIVWPVTTAAAPTTARQKDAARLLQQATFGPTPSELTRLAAMTNMAWLAEQMAMPSRPDFVNFVQSKYDLGDDYRPKGIKHNPYWVSQRFWATAATAQDQLRKRVAWAMHGILMVGQPDSTVRFHSRAYANYFDMLNKHAFGNYRALLEDLALSPSMGIYLSHMRNRKEDLLTGRLPDENFGREIMQLFSIGLYELNADGTNKLDGGGQPIETYAIDDVMALSKVFTGWSWAFPDSELSEVNFRRGVPDYSASADQRIDLQRMKAYPGMHSSEEKRLFAGKSNSLLIPSGISAQDSVRMALDALFNHPNVGPFVGRQLIQRLVTSNPSPAYVARVSAVFNNNGKSVRGDLGAVVRAILLDTEARSAPGVQFGKVREPVLRITNWMRAFGVASAIGDYGFSGEMESLGQRPMYAPSVFGYFRPNYVPPNSQLSASGSTAPEFQIVNETSVAQWVNKAESLATIGLGWTAAGRELSASYAAQTSLAAAANVDGLVENLNLLLFSGQMSSTLKGDIVSAVLGITGKSASNHNDRARLAVFVALSSPEYLVQR